MKNILFIFLFILAAVIPVTAADNSRGFKEYPDDARFNKPSMMPAGMQEPSILMFATELDLSSSQITSIMEMEKRSRKKSFALKEEMHAYFLQLQQEIEKETPDIAVLNTLADKMSENHLTFIKLKIEDMLGLKKILTKEQSQKMRTIMNFPERGEMQERPAPPFFNNR